MNDEQNIPGVPEGWRIVRVRMMKEYVDPYFEAIIERIPKPKKRVIIAEFIAPENACTGIYPIVTAEFHMQDDSRETVRGFATRIEEREDA